MPKTCCIKDGHDVRVEHEFELNIDIKYMAENLRHVCMRETPMHMCRLTTGPKYMAENCKKKEVDNGLVDQYRRNGQQNLDGKALEEPAVLSPLSSDSEAGERNSCSEGDECCIVSVGTQPSRTDRSLQTLESVQQELRVVNERADRALLQLKRRYGQLRKPHIQKRNAIIRTIPGFWVTAFLNHPQLSAMINDRDEDTLSYMNNLQVEDVTHLKSSCKIKFYFNSNPYFKNDVVIKEFQYGTSGRLTSHSTPIRWWRGQNSDSYHGKSGNSTPSFFSWFNDHSFPAADRIATIIKEDLWPNPLQYYLIGDGESDDHAAEDSDPDNTDDCVVIVDDDDDDDDNEDDEAEDDEGDEEDENEVHEISDNTEKQAEGTENDDEEDEEVEEESVPEDMVESTMEEESENIVVDEDSAEEEEEESSASSSSSEEGDSE
ncbi:PREDICTED: protein SET-like [Nanorana parkeri]|uniref:protein SET-like n=1 Tax=Nanorana parkeri TaxID=125878 RepID=UPI000854AA78|nr:PREDICTED: protein SET-like [Nanorana parkeri]